MSGIDNIQIKKRKIVKIYSYENRLFKRWVFIQGRRIESVK